MRASIYPQWAVEIIATSLEALDDDAKPDGVEAIGIYQIVLALAVAFNGEGLEETAIAINAPEKQLNVFLAGSSKEVSIKVDRWIAAVSMLTTAPNGWDLSV